MHLLNLQLIRPTYFLTCFDLHYFFLNRDLVPVEAHLAVMAYKLPLVNLGSQEIDFAPTSRN